MLGACDRLLHRRRFRPALPRLQNPLLVRVAGSADAARKLAVGRARPGLQIFRGVLIALALLPVRGFLYGKNGFLKLAWLVLGLSFISTIGPTPGSFDGYIYTILPVQYHLGGIPEAVLYTALFAGILAFWHKSGKRYVTVLSIVLVAIIVLLSVMGFLGAAQAE